MYLKYLTHGCLPRLDTSSFRACADVIQTRECYSHFNVDVVLLSYFIGLTSYLDVVHLRSMSLFYDLHHSDMWLMLYGWLTAVLYLSYFYPFCEGEFSLNSEFEGLISPHNLYHYFMMKNRCCLFKAYNYYFY